MSLDDDDVFESAKQTCHVRVLRENAANVQEWPQRWRTAAQTRLATDISWHPTRIRQSMSSSHRQLPASETAHRAAPYSNGKYGPVEPEPTAPSHPRRPLPASSALARLAYTRVCVAQAARGGMVDLDAGRGWVANKPGDGALAIPCTMSAWTQREPGVRASLPAASRKHVPCGRTRADTAPRLIVLT